MLGVKDEPPSPEGSVKKTPFGQVPLIHDTDDTRAALGGSCVFSVTWHVLADSVQPPLAAAARVVVVNALREHTPYEAGLIVDVECI